MRTEPGASLIAARSEELVKAVALEHKALREGWWNRLHMLAVDAASTSLEVALVEAKETTDA